ncbi:MAG: leucine-rich repeat domain-containing protein [Eubacterium sp.]
MKKIASVFLSIAMLISVIAPISITANAGCISFRQDYSTHTLYITNSTDGEVTFLPDSDNGVNRGNIEKIVFSEGIESVNISYLYGFSNVKTVEFPKSVCYISSGMFRNLESLTSIKVNSKNIAYCSISGVLYAKNTKTKTLKAFPQNKKADSFVLPSNVGSIDEDAFFYCKRIKSVDLSKVKKTKYLKYFYIGEYAFYGSSITSVKMPKLSTYVYSFAFGYCDNLKKLDLSKCKYVDSYTCSDCKNLSTLILPNIKTIPERLAEFCPKLKSVYVPGKVKSIGKYALGTAFASEVEVYKVKGFTLYSKNNSAAKSYAKKYGYKHTTVKTPASTSITSLSKSSKGFTVKWKKKGYSGYQIQYSTSSKFSSPKYITVSGSKNTSKKVSKLKGKKKYYVRIRTYKTVSGTKVFSSWSKAKSVTTKK